MITTTETSDRAVPVSPRLIIFFPQTLVGMVEKPGDLGLKLRGVEFLLKLLI
jgi:hypothetical protein